MATEEDREGEEKAEEREEEEESSKWRWREAGSTQPSDASDVVTGEEEGMQSWARQGEKQAPKKGGR